MRLTDDIDRLIDHAILHPGDSDSRHRVNAALQVQQAEWKLRQSTHHPHT